MRASTVEVLKPDSVLAKLIGDVSIAGPDDGSVTESHTYTVADDCILCKT